MDCSANNGICFNDLHKGIMGIWFTLLVRQMKFRFTHSKKHCDAKMGAKMNLIDELSTSYLNILVDLELAKNLEGHYIEVTETIKRINALINSGYLNEEESFEFAKLGYQYFRLKDALVSAMILKKQNDSDDSNSQI